MKAKYLVVALLVLVLALAGTACSKVTGGGWFNDFSGGKVTFGFNAQPTKPYDPPVYTDPFGWYEEVGAKGEFQLVAHGTNTVIHGTFTGSWVSENETFSRFFGTCTINGTDVQPFNVQFYDNGGKGLNKGDGIVVHIGGTNPMDPIVLMYSGDLGGGNIQIHNDKKK